MTDDPSLARCGWRAQTLAASLGSSTTGLTCLELRGNDGLDADSPSLASIQAHVRGNELALRRSSRK